MKLAAFLLPILMVQGAGDDAYNDALLKLEAGDAVAAEAAAREALAESLAFVPEQEIGDRPDKGLLFEDMILEARGAYRSRRARYFRTLGDALAAREQWRASRKAYRRSFEMAPTPVIPTLMADDEDLHVSERLNLLLDAYLSPGADRARLEEALLQTGTFRSRNALKAGLDARRFVELQGEFPDMELLDAALPPIQVVTDAGTLNTAEAYREGARLVLYHPVDTCASCSEQLDGITVPVMEAQRGERPLLVAAFVPEAELPIMRRIVRLLAMSVGVGRVEGLPPGVELAGRGEIRIVARGGLTQIRIPMSHDIRASEIRRRVEATFAFLDAPGLPTEEKPERAAIPLVTFEKQVNEVRMFHDWVGTLERLEAGPAPLQGSYEQLRRLTQRLARAAEDRDFGFEMMEALGTLRGAEAAKSRAFTMLGTDVGDRLLAAAQELDPDVKRTAPPGEGVFYVGVTEAVDGPRRVLMQRSFQTTEGLRHFNFLLEDDGADLKPIWLAPEDHDPRGVAAVSSGAAFRYGDDAGCDGLRLVEDDVIYQSCAAAAIDGEVVEVRRAIVDPVPNGPVYYKRGVVTGPQVSELERGLQMFDRGDLAGAVAAFDAAMDGIDPVAPYDASDLIYNRARALEEQGKRQEALALYRSLGDVHYQELVDEGAGRIEGAPR